MVHPKPKTSNYVCLRNPPESYLEEITPGHVASDGNLEISPEYANKKVQSGSAPLHHSFNRLSNIYELWLQSLKNFRQNNCLGSRPQYGDDKWSPYKWQSYQDVDTRVQQLSTALSNIGVRRGDRVGIYGTNSPEWMISLLACHRMGYICVPLYDSLGENSVLYIVNQTECKVVFVHNKKITSFMKSMLGFNHRLLAVVVWGTYTEYTPRSNIAGVPRYNFDTFEWQNQKSIVRATPPEDNDIAVILYTSNGGVDPLGVMISHQSLLSELGALKVHAEAIGFEFDMEQDIFISYLPLAHSFDFVTEHFMISEGIPIGYWRGDSQYLFSDMQLLKPTIMIGVPRIFERLHSNVLEAVDKSGFARKHLFNAAYKRKVNAIKGGAPINRAFRIGDRLLFNQIKQHLGGNLRLVIVGGAPLLEQTYNFVQVCLCAPCLQVYGLTECSGGAFMTYPQAKMAGTVGVCLTCNTFCLQAVPDMGFSPSDDPPRGEILLRGENIFQGYFKMGKHTEKVLERNGWFHTGDVGELSPEGVLRIIDQQKVNFKLSHGEYVVPEKLENQYKQCPYIDQIWIYGNSHKSFLVAIVVPNRARLLKELKQPIGITGAEYLNVCKGRRARLAILQMLMFTANELKLLGFEKVQNLYLEPEHFSVENNLLTAAHKLKRVPLLRKYQARIEQLYIEVKQN
eukprot:TRINITY_DN5113_c0_g1_i4.p1 TRINITY_DN5113_c0_g1~~TRINITY_DN5113_c0_g1_i4.p1  ORF type:complete len:682 (-),score=85.59 TRINITY_DN5113_c0_g1_i4:964-3009(-)